MLWRRKGKNLKTTLSLVQFLDSPDGSTAWWSSRDSAHPLFVRGGERVCTRGERATLSNSVQDRATHRDNICVCTTVCGLSRVTHTAWLVPAVLYQGFESESVLTSALTFSPSLFIVLFSLFLLSVSSSLYFNFHFLLLKYSFFHISGVVSIKRI